MKRKFTKKTMWIIVTFSIQRIQRIIIFFVTFFGIDWVFGKKVHKKRYVRNIYKCYISQKALCEWYTYMSAFWTQCDIQRRKRQKYFDWMISICCEIITNGSYFVRHSITWFRTHDHMCQSVQQWNVNVLMADWWLKTTEFQIDVREKSYQKNMYGEIKSYTTTGAKNLRIIKFIAWLKENPTENVRIISRSVSAGIWWKSSALYKRTIEFGGKWCEKWFVITRSEPEIWCTKINNSNHQDNTWKWTLKLFFYF